MNAFLNSPGQSAITSATSWLSSGLVASFTTTIAVIAIATMGLLLLFGRIDIRRAARLVVGCFIIFGASAIAQGIFAGLTGDRAGDIAQVSTPPPAPPPAPVNPKPNASPATPGANPFDPYGSGSTQQR